MTEPQVLKRHPGIVPPVPRETYYTPRVDIYETPEEFVFLCDVPGVLPADLDVRFENGELVILGKVVPRCGPAGCLASEYGVGDFYRAFTIPAEVAPEKIAAEYKLGVLTVHVPKAEKVRPKKIAVKAGG